MFATLHQAPIARPAAKRPRAGIAASVPINAPIKAMPPKGKPGVSQTAFARNPGVLRSKGHGIYEGRGIYAGLTRRKIQRMTPNERASRGIH
jgi:hypothetical protein